MSALHFFRRFSLLGALLFGVALLPACEEQTAETTDDSVEKSDQQLGETPTELPTDSSQSSN